MSVIRLLAPLCNLESDIVSSRLVDDFTMQRLSFPYLKRLLKRLDDEALAVVRGITGYCEEEGDPKHVYVIQGQYLTNDILPDSPDLVSAWMQRLNASESAHSGLERVLKMLRLYSEGHVFSPATYFYSKKGRLIEPEGVIATSHWPAVLPFPFNQADIPAFQDFFAVNVLPFKEDYINLAFDYFSQSYEHHSSAMNYINLMIAAEILFNDGHDELRYRISRGLATLLGHTTEESWGIFKAMGTLYDKRSSLVHSGKSNQITDEDVLTLRQYLRRAIKCLLNRGLTKESLRRFLVASGFGSPA